MPFGSHAWPLLESPSRSRVFLVRLLHLDPMIVHYVAIRTCTGYLVADLFPALAHRKEANGGFWYKSANLDVCKQAYWLEPSSHFLTKRTKQAANRSFVAWPDRWFKPLVQMRAQP
jgi:hypothetical protein